MVITGASRGIGAAIARAAAATHDVVVNHVTPATPGDQVEQLADELVGLGANVLVHRADMADERELVDMFAAIDRHFGRVDVLVNNAGIAGRYGTIDTVDAAMLQQLWAVNVTGAFVCTREAVARMATDRGGPGGVVINISSRAAVLGGPGEWVHYAASKGALDTMTSGLSKELAPRGIRVNGVRPGLIASDFHDHAPPGRLDRIAPGVPMARAGTPEEVAAAVVWLASPAASYVTGAFLDVSGGR
jgi:NAD(P)-dependent dehydrogenase (short-subunit alcohol dehydrogenase family)